MDSIQHEGFSIPLTQAEIDRRLARARRRLQAHPIQLNLGPSVPEILGHRPPSTADQD